MTAPGRERALRAERALTWTFAAWCALSLFAEAYATYHAFRWAAQNPLLPDDLGWTFLKISPWSIPAFAIGIALAVIALRDPERRPRWRAAVGVYAAALVVARSVWQVL
ncbi:MAG TPA: hypothetical protein VF576_11770 [Rubricoccaceae bacterium]